MEDADNRLLPEAAANRGPIGHDSKWAMKDGKFVHVDEVECGKDCGCICPNPDCKSQMIAKNKGTKREHHFAHLKGNTCEGYYETTMHLLAKKIIQERKCIMLPECPSLGIPKGKVYLHDIKVEEYDKAFDIKPDIEGYMEDGTRLLIEIKVSHPSDKRKIDIIKNNHLKCIEIDVKTITPEEDKLALFLTEKDEYREWLGPEKPTVASCPANGNNGDCRSLYCDSLVTYLMEQFAKGKLYIRPESDAGPGKTRIISRTNYLLADYAYDTMKKNEPHYGVTNDLLLYRSEKNYKGWISVNVRKRSRKKTFRYPEDLRIIDIIVPKETEEKRKNPSEVFSGRLIGTHLVDVYVEFKNFRIKEPMK